MMLQLVVGLVLLSVYSSSVFASENENQAQEESTPGEYILPGYVMNDTAAIELLHRQAEMTYQLNLPKYLEEMEATSPNGIRQQFDDRDFAIVGSLATLDASITFGEAIKNLQVVPADRRAGFEGLPNPENNKLHNHVQRLNAMRNVVWLLKEKMKSGVVTADQSLLDKLREAQAWLSTQTGGHLGQGMKSAFERAGIMNKLTTKWGENSLKFRSFSAAADNGLDFVINGYNTVVNSIAVNEEVTDSNMLALSSSVTAMAGDIMMSVSQILATSAKVASVAGPIGYAVAATLYIASYATGVASGMVGQDDLEPKDYVQLFLAPLVPAPDFAVMVEIFDAIAKGDVFHAYYLLMTQTTPAAFYIIYMAIKDIQTGSTKLRKYATVLNFLKMLDMLKKRDEFKKKLKENMKKVIQDIKPKQFLFAFPSMRNDAKSNEYEAIGWTQSSKLKSEFEITTELTNKVVFFATYAETFSKPLMCRIEAAEGYTFCPSVVSERGNNSLVFLGSNDLTDKVILEGNTEAYGMGGDDHFELKLGNKGTIKINGGPGSDIIDTRRSHPESHNYLAGGGPERDVIKGGRGKDIVSVDNDEVSDLDGDNIFLVEGSGNDDIQVGPGADLVVIMKSTGTASFSMHQWNHKTRDQQKPKRIVYDRDARLTHGENNAVKDVIRGSYTYHDVLSMTSYKPDTSTRSPDQRIVLLNEGKTVDDYISEISDVVDHLFDDHRGEVIASAHPGRSLMMEDAQHIYIEDIERFELSKYAYNLLLLKNNPYPNARHEVIGGALDDYVVNLDDDIALMAQMGTGANRVYAGPKNDSYSLILDESKDVIYDRGGENIVAVRVKDGWNLEDVQIIRDGGDRYRLYKKGSQEPVLEYVFHSESNNQDKVQFLFQDSTGKEVVFKMLARPQFVSDHFHSLYDMGAYHIGYEFGCEYRDIILKISPPKGETLNIQECKRKDRPAKAKYRKSKSHAKPK